jgi:hypothetical protein
MRRRILPLALLGILFTTSSLLLWKGDLSRAQSDSQAASDSEPAVLTDGDTVSTYSLHSGLWRVDNGFVSTIHIKNALVEAPLDVTPVLYLKEGIEYDLPPIHIPAMGVANVSINDALANAPEKLAGRIFDYGNAALRYDYTSPGHLFATMEITNLPRSMTLTYPFSAVNQEMSETQTLESLWWRHDPEVGGFVAVTNVTDEPLSVSLQVFGSQGTALEPLQVAAPPHWTQVLDLDALVGGLGGLENQAEGGFASNTQGRWEPFCSPADC